MDYFECEVVKTLTNENKGHRFENCGYNIRKKVVNKEFILYDCLLTEPHKNKINKSEYFKLVKNSKNKFNGDIYRIYCDAGVHNYGRENMKNINLSALTTIIFKNDKEIFRTTNVYEQFLDNNTVEILALLIAIRYLNKNEDNLSLRNSKIIVNSDSQNLQEYIVRPKIIKAVVKKCKENSESIYYSDIMRELLNELNYYLSYLDIYVGWVKGHTQINGSSSKAAIMNNICDKLCTRALKDKLYKLGIYDYKEEQRLKKKERRCYE